MVIETGKNVGDWEHEEQKSGLGGGCEIMSEKPSTIAYHSVV